MRAIWLIFGVMVFGAAAQSQEALETVPISEIPISDPSRAEADRILSGPITIRPHRDDTADKAEIEDPKDAFLLLRDGRVISFADWVWGSYGLDRNDLSPSDFDKLFITGQISSMIVGRVPEGAILRPLEDGSFRFALEGPTRDMSPQQIYEYYGLDFDGRQRDATEQDFLDVASVLPVREYRAPGTNRGIYDIDGNIVLAAPSLFVLPYGGPPGLSGHGTAVHRIFDNQPGG